MIKGSRQRPAPRWHRCWNYLTEFLGSICKSASVSNCEHWKQVGSLLKEMGDVKKSQVELSGLSNTVTGIKI